MQVRQLADAGRAVAVALTALGAAECLLALFQWHELSVVEAGGRSVCSFSATVNCETVWTSPLALRIHDALGIPVAGLGVVWGVAALGCGVLLLLSLRPDRSARPAVVALRTTALVGVLGCAIFAVGSVRAGALCLTCLVTYALVLAFAGVAVRGLPGPVTPDAGEWGAALGIPLGLAAVGALAVLLPGLAGSRRPHPGFPTGTAGASADVGTFLAARGPEERQALSDMLASYRVASVPGMLPPPRRISGAAEAAVRLVEWTDIRCGHCKHLVETLAELQRSLPPGRLSVEARNFPLDGTCNPLLHQPGNGVSCTGAEAQICLERAPDFWTLRDRLFAEQESLTRERIVEIASSGSVARAQMESCMASPETRARLLDDIRYAALYNPTGTPILTANGKSASPSGAFLYVLAMTSGNPDAPVLAALPPPRPLAAQ